MARLALEELPYQLDSAPLFARFCDLATPIFLDSSAPYCARGRYDIITAEPLQTLLVDGPDERADDFLQRLRGAISAGAPALHNDYHLPFVGGAVGFLSYDFGRTIEPLASTAADDIRLPLAVMGIYTWAIIVDHRQQRSVLLAQPNTPATLLTEIRQRLQGATPGTEPFHLTRPFQANMSRQAYDGAYATVQRYIHAGDCYQINLAQRFSAEYEGDTWAAYRALRKIAAAPYSAYMKTGDHAILSLSPERFLHVGNGRVTTQPIKGTRKRGITPEADQFLARQLLHSSKDRAENLMIVDLLRNDLGKSCIPGSIQVDNLFELQSFETVHHLVSTITGQLRPSDDALDLLRGCFPGGSITGAPKIRAMQIIEQLEPHRRSVYCGALGYISSDGQMDTNIAIRTLVGDGDRMHCWAGGGIVADSECGAEYEECFNKVSALLQELENRRH